MKDIQPTWPGTMLICACAAAFCLLGYLLSRMRDGWDSTTWLVLGLLVLAGIGFTLALFFLYLRPQYGKMAVPVLVILLLGHGALVAVLVRMGIAG